MSLFSVDPLSFITGAEDIIKRFIPDPAQATSAMLELSKLQSSTIIAEEQGESWLQRNWRPLTMLVFVAIIANNYLLYPYISLFWHSAPFLVIPPDMWGLLKLGLGGYVVGRTGEKITKLWVNK